MNKIYKILIDLDLCHLSVELNKFSQPKTEPMVNLKAWALINIIFKAFNKKTEHTMLDFKMTPLCNTVGFFVMLYSI